MTPSTFFIAFLCGNVWKNCNFAIFFKKFPLWNIFIRNWKKLRNSGPKNSSTFYTIFRRFVNFNKNGWKKFEKFWIFGHFIGKNRPKLAIFLQKSWISPIFGYFDVQFRHRHVQKTHRPLTLKIRPFGEISPNMATLASRLICFCKGCMGCVRRLIYISDYFIITNTEILEILWIIHLFNFTMASNLNLPPIPPKLKPIAHLLKTATGKIPTFRNVSEL